MPAMTIGGQIRRIRTEKGLTQTRVALLAGITPAAMNETENDKTDSHVSTLRAIADALGVPLSALVDDGDEDPAASPVAESA